MQALRIDPCTLSPECEALRAEVRAFLAEAMADVPPQKRVRSWAGASPAFSRKLGARGWIGMTWPTRYGGRERSALERYVVMEELLAAGAPVAAHWIAERQSALLLMRLSPEVLAPRIVPGIARGETYFCIGMSEPDSGSDLASVRTRAVRTDAGWVINGRKVWTSGAHRAHYMIALVRTGTAGEQRHAGLSQFLVDMKTPGLTVRPIVNQVGEHDFNEVTFDDVLVPHDCLVGTEGEGWSQVSAELAFERSGPERYLSSTELLLQMIDAADPADARQAVAIGRISANYAALRQMSLGVSGMLARGENPAQAAALVKDQGALVEQAMPDIAHDLFGGAAAPGSALAHALAYTTLAVPSFSLRGGTREILRGIIARGLGLR
ncbi:MAG: acyl-CoA dehydrogenase family protein [Burkholderiales bacterium]|nr:acyl-CoA dehydrogenase family protein [Burkholderiales bacterium]